MFKKNRKLNKIKFQLGAVIFLLAVFVASCILFWPSDFFKDFARAISGNYSKTDGQIIDANIWNTLAADFVSYTGASNNVDLGAHDFTVNADTLHVDSTNGRVGIGTVSPGNYKLDVAGDLNFTGALYQNGSPFSADSLWTVGTGGIYYSAGKVGIGINAPNKDLHIKTASGNAEIDIQSVDSPYWGIYQDDTTDDLRFWNVDNRMTITNEGNVGIGTTNPTSKLDVRGPDSANQTVLNIRGQTTWGTGDETRFDFMKSGTETSGRIANYWSGQGFSWGLKFYTYSSSNLNTIPSITLDPVGNVGIGTTGPGHDLHIAGTAAGARIDVDSGSADPYLDLRGVNDKVWRLFVNNDAGNGYFEIQQLSDAIDAFVIDRTGNVGIGTTAPDAPLNIKGGPTTTKGILKLQSQSVWTGSTGEYRSLSFSASDGNILGWIGYWDNNTGGIGTDDIIHFYNNAANGFRFHTQGGTNRVIIADNGNVGIGTTNPLGTLAVFSTTDVPFRVNGDGVRRFATDDDNNNLYAFGGWQTSWSDRNLKYDIAPQSDMLEKIMQTNPITYKWKQEIEKLDNKMHYGIIAQEIQEIFPTLVYEDEDGHLNVQRDEMQFILMQAVKELKSENDELKQLICPNYPTAEICEYN